MLNDKSAIHKIAQDYASFINSRDVEGVIADFADDCIMVDSSGNILKGKAELRDGFKRFYEQLTPEIKLELGEVSVRMLTPEIATWQAAFEFLPPINDDASKGYIVQIMSKVDDRWLRLETHVKLFPEL